MKIVQGEIPMNDAQTLFREGVLALRERKDAAEARRLLTESLRLNPQNEMAWLWLARTIGDPAKRLQCVERALSINPANEQALAFKQQLLEQSVKTAGLNGHDSQAVEDAPAPPKLKTAGQELTADEEKRIKTLLKKADMLVEQGDPEGAIEQWVRVLEIQVDHEIAMRNAVGYLSRLKYLDDARELVWRALEAGTQHPSIYLTAIDIARYQGNPGEVDSLRERLAGLPEADEKLIVTIVDQFIKDEQLIRALNVVTKALEKHPKSQDLLTRMGNLLDMAGRETEAMRYYDRAARLGTGTEAGREADKRLQNYNPVLTDRERGSLALAWREAAGFALVFILLGWQDSGLDLFQMDINHWIGVVLALFGGYFVITATSSPQQRGLAALLGGTVPDKKKNGNDDDEINTGVVEESSELPIIPPAFRMVIGLGGAVLLIAAFTLVFSRSLNLISNPIIPDDVPFITCDEFECYEGARQ